MAYGYRDVKYFLLKIHQHCGPPQSQAFNLNAKEGNILISP